MGGCCSWQPGEKKNRSTAKNSFPSPSSPNTWMFCCCCCCSSHAMCNLLLPSPSLCASYGSKTEQRKKKIKKECLNRNRRSVRNGISPVKACNSVVWRCRSKICIRNKISTFSILIRIRKKKLIKFFCAPNLFDFFITAFFHLQTSGYCVCCSTPLSPSLLPSLIIFFIFAPQFVFVVVSWFMSIYFHTLKLELNGQRLDVGSKNTNTHTMKTNSSNFFLTNALCFLPKKKKKKKTLTHSNFILRGTVPRPPRLSSLYCWHPSRLWSWRLSLRRRFWPSMSSLQITTEDLM